ncbi:MAG: hypothetical protein JSS27_01055 [Planctomycetes bacterium]|nr:hypothetical protein [Planctomycetota bacterium]
MEELRASYDNVQGMMADHPVLFLALGLVVFMYWDKIKAAVAGCLANWKPAGAATSAAVTLEPLADHSAESALALLQSLTAWAVKNATPELLAKFTALHQDLQQHVQAEQGGSPPVSK